MPSSTRFAVSVHLMALLASDRSVPKTSEILANSVNTNAAVVRRLLSALSRPGLVQTQLGKGGGALLGRGPKKITLADIYLAVEQPGLIALHRSAPDPSCPIGGHIQPVLESVNATAEAAFMESLQKVTLKQMAKEIAAQNAAAKSAA